MPNVDLDDPASFARLDPSDMYRRVNELPEQMEDGWKLAGEIEIPEGYREVSSIVIAGMGGSAIGGSLLETYAIHDCPIPLGVWRNYGLPEYVDDNSLVVIASYSGKTEETLSAMNEARRRGAKILAITTDGDVAKLAQEWWIPAVTFHYEAQPRATLGYLFTPLVRLFQSLAFLPNQEESFREALAVVKGVRDAWNAQSPSGNNLAKQLAQELQGRLAVVYGADYLSAVARRWKTQFNENAKNWAFYEEFPELDHNAIVGYEHPPAALDAVRVLILSGSQISPRIARRIEVTQQIMDEYGVAHRILEAKGQGILAQMFSTIALGDYVTYYLALLNGADPSTIRPINILKDALAKS